MTIKLSENFCEVFSAWMVDQMKVRGFTQMDLCRKTGVSRTQIGRIVRGESDGMTIGTLVKICDSLGYDIKVEIVR